MTVIFCILSSVFVQGIIIIDRTVEDVFEFIADMKSQLSCWEMIHVPNLAELEEGATETVGMYHLAGKQHTCDIELYITRPGSGVVTRLSWDSGELAAEWRIMESGGRTKIELNVEGNGGGLATSVSLRQMAPRILNRVKQHFDMA